jgi:hypothetical protein
MSKTKRIRYSAEFKAKVSREAMKERAGLEKLDSAISGKAALN